jgi:lipopolysaccharide export system permease protein
MRILDRSIARQYLLNVLLLFGILLAIILIADFALQFDEYAKIAGKNADGTEVGGLRRIVVMVVLLVDLWWPRFFQLYNYLLGIIMVGAMGFTLSQMVRHRELVAVLASGVSLQRLAFPIVVVALALSGLQALNREYIVPRIADLLTREKFDAGTRSFSPTQGRGGGGSRLPVMADAKGRIWYAQSFDPARAELTDLSVYERDEEGLPLRRITAPRATWDGQQAGHGAWVLEDGVAQPFDAGDSPQAAPAPIGRLETDLDPTTLTLRRFESYGQNISTAHLGQLIESYRAKKAPPERIDALNRIRFARVTVLAANILSLLVCMPFFLRRTPTNMLLQSVYCAPVAIITVMGSTLGASANIPGIPPLLGALIPVMVLIPLSVAAMSSVRT